MGKYYKKRKNRENKNEKIEKCEVEVEKNQEKKTIKRKSFWPKWLSVFWKPRKKTTITENWQYEVQETESPNMMVNAQTLDLKRWGLEEANTQVLNIPLEPGRHVSTILLTPTKTGFKAIIAHNRVSPDMAPSQGKYLNNVSGEPENRRTLTLVFDMNMNELNEAAVRRGETVESKHTQFEKNNKDISASALFVRTGVDEIVESAGFLQAQLSLHSSIIQSQVFLPDGVESLTTRRPTSWQNLKKSRVTFKTKSEPIWREKQSMLKETGMSENMDDMFNQFIFLDQNDSFMSYSNAINEVPSRKNISGRRTQISFKKPSILGLVQCSKEDVKRDHVIFTSNMSFSIDKLSSLTPSTTRNVAPNVLVNIKPFKQRINVSRPEFSREMVSSGNDKVKVNTKKTTPITRMISTEKETNNSTRPRECISKTEPRLILSPNRNRLAVCLRCGVEGKGGETVTRKSKISFANRNIFDSKTGTMDSHKISPGPVEETKKCSLCSTWKMYNRKCFGFIEQSSSVDNILEEFKEYDHNTVFRRNLSQFRRKIKPNDPPVEFMKSHSSLSFVEVVEVEEAKSLGSENSMQSDTDLKLPDHPNVTLGVTEFVQDSGEKTVTFERIKKSLHKLEVDDYKKPNLNILYMENLSLVYNYQSKKSSIKMEAEKIEHFLSTSLVNVTDLYVPQEPVIIICPVNTNHLPIITLRKSECQFYDSRGTLTRRSGQIPNVINHLWAEKIDDVRNELIMRMKETRIFYDPSRVDNLQVINLRDSKKVIDENFKTTKLSDILNLDVVSTPSNTGLNNWVGFAEIPDISELCEKNIPASSENNQFQKKLNAPSMEDMKEFLQGKDSRKFYSEDSQSTGPNDRVMSFTSPNLQIYTSLMLFEPQFKQIQTPMEILNSVTYNFPVTKDEDKIDRKHHQIMQSCTFLSDKKNLFVVNELESVVMNERIEKNVVNGEITQMSSRKEVITIKESHSGNHLLFKNKKILTTSDRIKKSEISTKETKYENEKNDKIQEDEMSLSLDRLEDLHGVQCLYYKQARDTGELSGTSNSLDEKMSESQRTIIVIREPKENQNRTDSQINEYETFYGEASKIQNQNTENYFFDDIDFRELDKLSTNQMKSRSTNVLLCRKCDASVACDHFSGGFSSLSDDLKVDNSEQMSNVKATQSSPCDSQTKSISITDNFYINKIEENEDIHHKNLLDKFKKTKIQNSLTNKKINTPREAIHLQAKERVRNQSNNNSTLTNYNNSKRKSSKNNGNDFTARGIIKNVETKYLDLKSKDRSKEDESHKKKSTTRKRSTTKTHVSLRKGLTQK